MSKRDVSASVNMCKPSCFRDSVTCLRNVSVCGFLLFRPVNVAGSTWLAKTGLEHKYVYKHVSTQNRCTIIHTFKFEVKKSLLICLLLV